MLSETYQIEYILFMHLSYFYGACFFHHFFQVSPPVCHLSNKKGSFLFYPHGGYLTLSSCIRLILM